SDPVAAFRNLGNALRSGGRLCMAVWASIEDNLHWKVPFEIAVARVGPPAPTPPHAPGPMAFRDPDYVRDFLNKAGFIDIAIEKRGFHVIGRSAKSEAEMAVALGPSGRLLDEKAADDATREALAAAIEPAIASYASPNGEIRMPGTVLLVKARR